MLAVTLVITLVLNFLLFVFAAHVDALTGRITRGSILPRLEALMPTEQHVWLRRALSVINARRLVSTSWRESIT